MSQLSIELQQYLNRYLAEFSSDILITKAAKTNGDSHSIFNLIRDGLELSQQIETNLSMLSSSRQKELKKYLRLLIRDIEKRNKFLTVLCYVIILFCGTIVLGMHSIFFSGNYYLGLGLFILSLLVTVLIVYKQLRLSKLKLDYELLLIYLT